jgi:L-alanine-DL-glutamate epimerase-like enolase superfamily enzyme
VTVRISKLDVLMFALQLKEPFRFAYGTFHEVPRVLIRLETEDGAVGYGEAAIDFPFAAYDMFDIYIALSELGGRFIGKCVEDRLQVLISKPLRYLPARHPCGPLRREYGARRRGCARARHRRRGAIRM